MAQKLLKKPHRMSDMQSAFLTAQPYGHAQQGQMTLSGALIENMCASVKR